MPKEITIIWTTEDIRAAYTGLSEEQAEEVLFDLEHNHDSAEMRRLAQSAAGLDLARVKSTLPALPALLRVIVKMPLGARFELIAAHDRRHLWQAEQVRNHPDFPR